MMRLPSCRRHWPTTPLTLRRAIPLSSCTFGQPQSRPFEFTYEPSLKMAKRHLEQVSPNPAEFDEMSFKAIMREAFRRGLVQSDVSIWDQYRTLRGTTSHTYNAGKAQMVFESLTDFLREARFLRDQLQQRNDSLDDPD